MEIFLKPKIFPKESNYFIEPEKFSFTEFKSEISEAIKKVEVPKENKDKKVRILNFIKMVNFNQSREFIVFGEKRFDREVRSEEIKTKYTFDYFRKEISLPDFLRNYGFEIDKKEVRRTVSKCVMQKQESCF